MKTKRSPGGLWRAVWATMAEGARVAENCNAGKDPCTLGKKAKLAIQPIRPADMERYKQIIETAVLPNFAKRCGPSCTAEWNTTVGKALGLVAKPN